MGDFGTRLREARERKGISLRQIAAATKISVGALESLERNDISKLPGGIFSRAFVRSYAIEVGLDPDETVRYFLQQFGGASAPAVQPPAPVAPPAPPKPASRPAPRYAPPAPDVSDEVDFESRQRMAGVVLKLVLVSVPIAIAIMYFNSRGATPAAHEETSPPVAAAPATHEGGSPPPASAVSQTPEPAVLQPPAPQPPAPPEPAVVAPAQPAETADMITIEVAPSADCWTKLTTDGEVVVSRVVAAGEREKRSFRDTAVLQVGDAAVCAFTINGRPAKTLGEPGRVREIQITRDNYTSFLQ